MKKNFLKTSAVSPSLRVADVKFNTAQLAAELQTASENGVELLLFPRLSLCGCTCGDLFFQPKLIAACEEGLRSLAERTANIKMVAVVGAPVEKDGALYDCAVFLGGGRVLAIICNPAPQSRWFEKGEKEEELVELFGLNIAVAFDGNEVRTDAELILHLPASPELVRVAGARREALKKISYETPCAVLSVSPNVGESSTDNVYSGHALIVSEGALLAEALPFQSGKAVAGIDITALKNARRQRILRKYPEKEKSKKISPTPFLPMSEEREEYCETALEIQAQGLAHRLRQIGAKTAVLGVSGGLDSTLALLVTARAFDLLNKDRKEIIGITMPGFGTTGKTYGNALKLIKTLGATLREIPITESVSVHFKDIGHNGKKTDAAYENAQARMRTLILMDVANMENGIVVGTGDLSELALGWCTYNGDHMSMYSVNASVPKTLVKYLVAYASEKTEGELKEALLSVVNTEISPELLPPDAKGNIAQKTEDLVGPYELHDFYLYHAIYEKRSPKEVFALAKQAFEEKYTDETLKKWLKNFYRRFFSQQFKRSCSPDGVQVTCLSLSPRVGWQMPSDAIGALWIEETETL